MVKSNPGEATDGVDDFLGAAKAAATEGVVLVQALSNWVRKSKRAMKREKGIARACPRTTVVTG
jgi:hypothetical protein